MSSARRTARGILERPAVELAEVSGNLKSPLQLEGAHSGNLVAGG